MKCEDYPEKIWTYNFNKVVPHKGTFTEEEDSDCVEYIRSDLVKDLLNKILTLDYDYDDYGNEFYQVNTIDRIINEFLNTHYEN